MDPDHGPYYNFDVEAEESPDDLALLHQFHQRGFNHNGGYMDGKVLKYSHTHLSKDVYTRTSYTGKFKGHGAINPLVTWYKDLPAPVKTNVHAAGFGHFMQILPSFRCKTSVIVGLAERWWDTTNTFHLPLGEMTMTPQDFSMITGLKIDGRPLLFCPLMARHRDRIVGLLGPKFMQYYQNRPVISCSYLRVSYEGNKDLSGENVNYMTQAFIIYLLGSSLLANSNGTVNLGLLESLADIKEIHNFNWGESALGALHGNMGELSRTMVTSIVGFYWAWEMWCFSYFPSFAPKGEPPTLDLFPKGQHYKQGQIKRQVAFDSVLEVREALSALTANG